MLVEPRELPATSDSEDRRDSLKRSPGFDENTPPASKKVSEKDSKKVSKKVSKKTSKKDLKKGKKTKQ